MSCHTLSSVLRVKMRDKMNLNSTDITVYIALYAVVLTFNLVQLYIQFNSQINAADRQNNEYNMHKRTRNRAQTEVKIATQLKTNSGNRHRRTAYW